MLYEFTFPRMLLREAGPDARKLLIFGVLSGLFEALIVVCINTAASHIGEEGLDIRGLGLLALCIIGYVYCDRYTLTRCMELVGAIIYDTHVRLVSKIRRAGLLEFERLERSDVYGVLMEHTEVLVEATRYFGNSYTAAVMLLTSAIYIASISVEAFMIVLVVNAVGLSTFVVLQNQVTRKLRAARELKASFIGHVNHLLAGFKEVKVNAARGDDLFENHIVKRSDGARTLKVEAEVRFCNNYLFVHIVFFLVVAAVIFLVPRLSGLDQPRIMTIVAAVLFTIGPLGQVVLAAPFFTKAELAVRAIGEMEARLDTMDDMAATRPDSKVSAGMEFQEIALEDVVFSYTEIGGQRTFLLGPVSFTLRRGELVMLAGGNGCGKSTLLKLLCGLYYPQSGTVRVDDVVLDPGNYAHYRELFSVIFADFHVFDRLYGMRGVDEAAVNELLAAMRLSERTHYTKGRFTDLDLSTGQRKRMALVQSRLENRPVCLFDEVAADFDPDFRRHFYESLLPELKAQGKTIVAVSHDDRYYHLADRLLRMEYGRVVAEERRCEPPHKTPGKGSGA